METGTTLKRKRKGIRLNTLFWRYFLTTGGLMAALCLIWLILFNILVNMGFVLSAYTAVRNLPQTEQALQAQTTFDSEKIPHYYEWALTEDKKIIESNMNKKQLKYAYAELYGDTSPHGWFYSQYFHLVPLKNGQAVMLEYDYSVCYANPDLQNILPDFQTAYIGLLFVLLLLLTVLRTGHYTKILRKDTNVITNACEMVRNQKLDVPLQDHIRVKELQAALTAIDTLRQELSHSLKEQWTAEQRKNETLASLAHDLKTPLTVIGGNAELLAEDDLTPPQKALAQTILRNAGHAEAYVKRLREVTAEDVWTSNKTEISVCELLDAFVQKGRDLSAVKGHEFIAAPSASLSNEILEIEKNDVLRALENLLSNAVRFTPAGKTIELGVELQEKQIGFWVQDSGPGFSPEALIKAGKTFYTEDNSRPQDGHMGMGLYFASQTAQKHGGSLFIENTAMGGRVCLWLKKGSAVQAHKTGLFA